MQSNIKKYFYLIIILLCIFVVYFPVFSYAAYPALITTISGAFVKINAYLKALGAPATITAIGTGVFIKKFSFGDEERIRIGKRLIKTAVFSYAFLLCADLLISTINTVLGQ